MNKTSVHNEPRITVDAFNRLLAQEHPFAAMLDIEVLDIGYGTAVLRLPDRSKHKRLGGIVAGPMLMGLADLALNTAVVGAPGHTHAVTASLQINCMRQAPAGGILANERLRQAKRRVGQERVCRCKSRGTPCHK